jgi:Protein of unknown function (DUF1592)/Protein of unknown function (DUF1588)/Protein of unknown function (DUF1595)/Protein of unknown function (DUF1587)/Protein of unknown function (DUF1585)
MLKLSAADRRWATCLAVLVGLGCSGAIDPAGGRPGGPAQPGPRPGNTGGTGGTTVAPEDPGRATPPLPPGAQAMFKPGPASLRRLTGPQYTNTIRDLLGADVAVPGGFDPDTVLSGFASVGASLTTLSAGATEKFEAAALNLAEQMVNDPARRTRLVGCTPAGPADDACARSFVTGFGRRAWRRPLTDEEANRYVALARDAGTALGDFWKGLGYVLSGLLQSPHFLYRVEIGRPVAGAGHRAFDDWELASRLSFFLWNSTPDDALLDAAQAGRLTRGDGGLRAEAVRLIESPRARPATRTFFHELLRLDGADDLEQSPANFPQVTATLGPSMREETLRFLEEIVLSPAGDFRQALDLDATYVNAELARLYGLPAPAGGNFQRASLPADGLRRGLLGQAAFLALNAHETTTSPTRRGKFVRESVLCHEIPAPPPDVDASLPPEPPGNARTMRERLAAHDAPTCNACHRQMDPIGLAYENFDAIGKFRQTDGGRPIDVSGELDGARFQDPRELGALLRKHPDVETCLVRGVYRFALGQIETADQDVLIKHIGANLPAEQRWRALLVGLVDSQAFRLAAENP